jgi:hypothetical protein
MLSGFQFADPLFILLRDILRIQKGIQEIIPLLSPEGCPKFNSVPAFHTFYHPRELIQFESAVFASTRWALRDRLEKTINNSSQTNERENTNPHQVRVCIS